MSEPEPVLAARDRDRPASLDAIELESFHRARRFLSSILDLDELLRALLEEGLGAVGGTRGFVGLVNRPRAELDLRITAGKGWDTLPIRSMQIQAGPGSGITLQVVRTGEPYLTGDVRNDPYYRMFFPDVRSELAVPLLNRDGIALGVLNIESEEVNAFSYRDLQLLMALANQAAIAVSVARLRVRETALLEVGQELTSAVSMEELLQCVVRAARDLVRADDCSVFQLDEEGEYLTLRAAGELLQPHVGTLRYRVGEGLTGWVGQSGTAVRVPDVRADARWVDVFPPLPAGTVETFLATPVFARGALWGVLRAVRRQPAGALIPHTFSRRDEEFAQLLAGQMGAALTRQTLVEQ
ncbi:MAG: GAF domain-containing protein, partial [Armatimonadetes bacterium]|nr:GAF domain-containing protein [Armatimonadota bacterium]